MAQLNSLKIRELVDKHFSLQWCRENIIIPIGVERNQATGSEKLTIAIGNFSYLGTIGDFIKRRVGEAGFECQFIEKAPEEIQKILDEASQQRLVSGEGLEGFEFFGYALGFLYGFGEHKPGRTDIFSEFRQARNARLAENPMEIGESLTGERGGIGTPDDMREHLRKFVKKPVTNSRFCSRC